jgi:hypothetical protein
MNSLTTKYSSLSKILIKEYLIDCPIKNKKRLWLVQNIRNYCDDLLLTQTMTCHSNSKNTRQMQKYYRAVVTMTAERLLFDKDGLHNVFKVGYKKKTTSTMSHSERVEYLDNVIYFIAMYRGRVYDSDWRHHEQISYYDLPDALIDFNF